MTRNSLQIKNLSIALEALSRIQQSSIAFDAIQDLLDEEIAKAKEYNETPIQPVSSRNPDDDIPF